MNTQTGCEHILADRQGGVLKLTLNRPDKLNALSQAMYSALAQALKQADHDDDISVVLIQGSSQCFSSGNDLADFLKNQPASVENSPVMQFIYSVLRLTKPLVAGVAGHAVGIGTTLLLHCDLVYLSQDARLQTPFVKLGLTPEFGASWLLPRRVGRARAAQLLLLGEAINADQALDWGLANAVLADGAKALARAEQAAAQLAALPTEAVAISRRLLCQSDVEQLARVVAQEAVLFAKRLASTQAQAAFNAFLTAQKD